MTALLAIRGTDNSSQGTEACDCYAFLQTATWAPIDYTDPDPIQISQRHMSTVINHDADGGCEEVAFDSDQIQGTFLVDGGENNLVGIWLLSEPTITGTLGDDDGHIGESSHGVPNWDPTPYIVPDLRPAANAYMFTRGRVWPPGQREHTYP